jgi:RNA polymerase sigma-70 factor (ECF subfamily)
VIDWPGIVRDESPQVWRLARRLLGDHADAADCVQEVFTQALQISRREPVTNWAGLLRHLATVQALQRLRNRYREKARDEILLSNCAAQSAEPGPVENAEAAELAQALRIAVTELPQQEAEVFCLRCLEELTYQEIADQLGIEVNAVGVALHRARSRLRGLLAAYVRRNADLTFRGAPRTEDNEVRQ